LGIFWYALYVRPRFEKLVHYQLVEKGYETFFPSYIRRRKWSDRVKSLCLPLFPGHVFCRFDINARLPILITPGVNFVVGVGNSKAGSYIRQAALPNEEFANYEDL